MKVSYKYHFLVKTMLFITQFTVFSTIHSLVKLVYGRKYFSLFVVKCVLINTASKCGLCTQLQAARYFKGSGSEIMRRACECFSVQISFAITFIDLFTAAKQKVRNISFP